MCLNGYIKLHRKLMNWGWYQDHVVKEVFIHLLLIANYKDKDWQGIELKKGQAVIGTKKLAEELGFSRQQIRTALLKLQRTNEITVESNNRYSIVTIVKWSEYQEETDPNAAQNGAFSVVEQPTDNQQSTGCQPTDNQQATNCQPTDNQQITNEQPQYKKDKKDKKEKKGKKRVGAPSPHGRFENVFLTQTEVSELKERYPHYYEAKIEKLSRYLVNNLRRNYENHFAVLLEWLAEDVGEKEPPHRTASYDIDELDRISEPPEFEAQDRHSPVSLYEEYDRISEPPEFNSKNREPAFSLCGENGRLSPVHDRGAPAYF